MYEIFVELMDQIFWVGYAEQLAEDNPTAFNYEFDNFLNIYGHGA